MNKKIGSIFRIFAVLVIVGALFLGASVIAGDSPVEEEASEGNMIVSTMSGCSYGCFWCGSRGCDASYSCC